MQPGMNSRNTSGELQNAVSDWGGHGPLGHFSSDCGGAMTPVPPLATPMFLGYLTEFTVDWVITLQEKPRYSYQIW